MRTLSELLIDLKTILPGQDISLDGLITALHERGIGFILFLFALPAALPIPAIGINVIIALPLLLFTAQQAMGRHTAWVPKSVRHKSISKERFTGFIDAALPYIGFVEKFIKPRLEFATQGFFSRLIGVTGFIMALSVTIPLPLTNTVPSFGIALMAVGVIMRDGLAVLAGMIIGLIWVGLIFGLLAFMGLEGLDMLKEAIKSLI